MEKKVQIECFNPYESKFPKRRVVSRTQLHLIKTLKSNNIEFQIVPSEGGKLNYLAQKDLISALNDPIILTLYNIGIGVVSAAILGFIKKAFGKDNSKIIFYKDKERKYYNYEGKQLDDATILELNSSFNEKQTEFKKSFNTPSPIFRLPVPVHLEHKPEIVGWCNVSINDIGLHVDEMVITCKKP